MKGILCVWITIILRLTVVAQTIPGSDKVRERMCFETRGRLTQIHGDFVMDCDVDCPGASCYYLMWDPPKGCFSLNNLLDYQQGFCTAREALNNPDMCTPVFHCEVPDCSVCETLNCTGSPEYLSFMDISAPDTRCDCDVVFLEEELVGKDKMYKCTVTAATPSFNTRRMLWAVTGSLYINYESAKLFIEGVSSVQQPMFLELEIGYWHDLVTVTEDMVYELPAQMTVRSGVLTVIVHSGVDIIGQSTFDIVGVTYCEIVDCLFCWGAWNNFKCLPYYYKVYLIGVLVFCSALLLCLLPVAVKSIWYTAKFLCCAGKNCILCPYKFSKSRIAKKVGNKMKEMKKSVGGLLEEEEALGEPVSQPTRRYTKLSDFTSRVSTSVILFSMLFGCCSALNCGSTISIQSSSTVCEHDGDLEICTIHTSATSTLSGPGSSICFNITNPQDSAHPNLGIVMLEYLREEEMFSMVSKYWTASWVLESACVHRCWLAGMCRDDNCPNQQPDDVTLQGELTDHVVMTIPGESYCRAADGGWDMNCFHAHDSCVFCRVGPHAMNQFGRVFQIGQSYRKPVLRYSILSPDGQLVQKNITFTGPVFTDDKMTFQIPGEFSRPPHDLGHDYVLQSSTAFVLVDAAPINGPIPGMIGDIQGPSLAGLHDPTPTSYRYAPGLWTTQEQHKYDTYNALTPGWLTWQSGITLPNAIEGNLWKVQDGFLASNITDAPALDVFFQTEGNFTITRVTNRVCPKLSYINSTGCYSCVVGAEVTIDVWSECAAGLVSVQSSDNPSVVIHTPVLALHQYHTTAKVFFTSSISTPSFHICLADLSYLARRDCILVSPTLVSVDDLVIPNDTHIDPGQTPGAVETENFWDKVFMFTGEWWHTLIFVLIVVGGIIFFIFFVGLSWALWKTFFKAPKKMYQYVATGSEKQK